MRDEIDDVIKRTQRYWYVDGLTEIAIGFLLVLVGLLFYAQETIAIDASSAPFVAIGVPAVMLGAWWLSARVVKAVKERVTYPRTGYVSYRQTERRPGWLRIGVAIIIGFGMALLLGTISGRLGSTQWIYALNGIVIGLSVFFVGYRVGLARFYAMAMLSALIGFAIALSGRPDAISNLLYFALFGLAWIASGALTLRHYLSSTQPASKDESV